jgi:hypothetical protein
VFFSDWDPYWRWLRYVGSCTSGESQVRLKNTELSPVCQLGHCWLYRQYRRKLAYALRWQGGSPSPSHVNYFKSTIYNIWYRGGGGGSQGIFWDIYFLGQRGDTYDDRVQSCVHKKVLCGVTGCKIYLWAICRDTTENGVGGVYFALQINTPSPACFGRQMLYTCHGDWPTWEG